jgi:hypothetical protein
MQESSGTSKTLMNLVYSENLNDVKAAKMAFQAYDEGSIPFTRSKQNQTKRALQDVRTGREVWRRATLAHAFKRLTTGSWSLCQSR